MLEAARTFVPGWWIDAFENALTVRGEETTPQMRVGAMPSRLDASELSILAIILGDIQRQVFTSDDSRLLVELDWQASQKQLPAHDVSSREKLARVIHSVPTLRFLTQGQGHRCDVSYLFSSETWLPSMPGESSPKLSLKLTDRGFELLCGYIDAHLDMLGDLDGSGSLRSVNFGRQPLVLWTPIWLELGLTEQVLYSRMEQTMQTQGSWLRLDGLVGAPLESLTCGLKFSKKNSEPESVILERLRLVAKLGRRLVAHGLLQKEPSNDYMAISGQSRIDSPMLLWQASAERLKSRAEAEYFGLASSRILKGPISARSSRMIEIFAKVSQDPGMSARLGSIWQAIESAPGCGLNVASGVMIQGHMLFLEWIARAVPSSLLPLNPIVAAHSVCKAIGTVTAANAARTYVEFTKILGRSCELGQIAEGSIPNGLPFSMALAPLPKDIRARLATVASTSASTLSSHGFGAQGPETDLNSRAESVLRTPLNPISVKQDSNFPKITDKNAQRLRKMAQDELEVMMRQAPQAYANLKNSFLSSLDSEKKSLVLDVQRRLDSREFDRQLKPRIVRFMVEHPGTWRSVSNTLLS
jgi:hypothetical protein